MLMTEPCNQGTYRRNRSVEPQRQWPSSTRRPCGEGDTLSGMLHAGGGRHEDVMGGDAIVSYIHGFTRE